MDVTTPAAETTAPSPPQPRTPRSTGSNGGATTTRSPHRLISAVITPAVEAVPPTSSRGGSRSGRRLGRSSSGRRTSSSRRLRHGSSRSHGSSRRSRDDTSATTSRHVVSVALDGVGQQETKHSTRSDHQAPTSPVSSQSSLLAHLPLDAAGILLSYLEPNDILRLACTCQDWGGERGFIAVHTTPQGGGLWNTRFRSDWYPPCDGVLIPSVGSHRTAYTNRLLARKKRLMVRFIEWHRHLRLCSPPRPFRDGRSLVHRSCLYLRV